MNPPTVKRSPLKVKVKNHNSASASSPRLPDAKVSEENLEKGTESSLCSYYEEKIRPCIDLIDSLRALGVEQDLALPAIAVIGDQSSGKSSVLEALSGVALPRGSGIVTRCPLVLKLRKLRDGDEWKGKVSYKDQEIEMSDASEVEEEIRKAQDVIAGVGMDISHELINLEVSSPHVPDLTLIDLPGITRVALGNQPADIGFQIKRLIKKYILKQQTINLVVVPSNVDIATTEALSMAQEVDPDGDRTIGILTKPDLVDKGTENKVVDVVRNLVCHLKKGYMIVKCRGQQDIQEQLSLTEALQKEKAFFEDHPHFRNLLDEGKATIPCLAERLTTELIAHICVSTRSRPISGENPKRQSRTMATADAGTRAPWGCRYDAVYNEICKFENQYRGRELPGFVNYKTFENIIKQQIKTLEEPAVDMLHTVTQMVWLAFTEVSQKNYSEFFNLYKVSKSKIEDIKTEQEREAEKSIRLHFQMEQIVYCQDTMYQRSLRKIREKEKEKEEERKRTLGRAICEESSSYNSLDEIFQHLIAYHQRILPPCVGSDHCAVRTCWLSSRSPDAQQGAPHTAYRCAGDADGLEAGSESLLGVSTSQCPNPFVNCSFQETGNRLSTHIPLTIQFFVLQSFGQQLQKAMLQLLQDKEQYDWLLKERSDTCDKRKFLKEQHRRLVQARHQLAKFPG
ncbi:Interferon-induced GTP-binding protein Mx1 [Pteropus alecto]|uniref:Interferon-induced GTP-binding protein Mx1 n=1 Tax=Pteropus alecto TaxID=9402 RepID=L5KAD8_PTEAL|nr:Interferon-induced GTP-binding protein Mx1 [Pteropus alecto]